MFSFKYEIITDHVKRITDTTNVCEYLIEGKESALLIDTGYGLGNLRGYVESLTDKPYEVICTHGHLDHAGGAGQFNEVYLNPLDLELADKDADLNRRKEYLSGRFPEILVNVCDADYVEQRTSPYLPLSDGQEFDLGELTVRAIHVPGHTQGMMVLLDVEERIAFFGDACGVFTLMVLPEASTIEEYLKSLRRLREHAGEFDRVLRQHGTCESPTSILDGNIELCELVLAREDDAQPVEFAGVSSLVAKEINPDTKVRLDGGEGNLVYLPEKLR